MIDTIYFKIIYVMLAYLLGSVLLSYAMAAIYGRGEKRDLYKIDRPGTAGAGSGGPAHLHDVATGDARRKINTISPVFFVMMPFRSICRGRTHVE